jgi:type II secretory ATPase GspE/PulE/Tfp pilus assembly ATPase PilB-like protein
MRIDGVLEQVHALPASSAASLISRIKVMAHLNIAEKRAPQDGRFRHTVAGAPFDIRVAIIPTILGERITLRLLGLDRSRQGLKSLGMNQSCRKTMTGLIHQPHGIILITGPTGSGKTTTLYAAMNLINDVTKHIITVENPVEYSIEGVNQIQISAEARITFASALRSILRHDPDVIMVGEIRDQETAHLALEASLTGHLVFATLHTNSACGALTRLLDMGAEPFLIASGVMACVAQRLVRRICLDCKETYQASKEEIAYCRLPDGDKPVQLARGKGCSSCRGSGFSDRTGLFEIAETSPALGQLIMGTASAEDMQQLAVNEGMTTLRQDGVAKACAGITTLAEVIRVTRD